MDHRGLRRAVGLHVDLARGDHRRHRGLAAAERFRQCRHIRHDARLLKGEEVTGPAHAALDLIGDPQHAVLVAQRAQLAPEFDRRLDDAAAALDRLEHDDTDFRVRLEGIADGVDVAERHLHGVAGQLEFAAVELGVGQRQHALGLAVKRVLGIDDLRPLRSGGAFGHLDRSLHGFRAGRTEEHHVEISRRDRRQVLGQRRSILAHEGDGDLVPVLVLELLSRRDDARMIVAERQRSEAAEEIENLPSGLVGVVHARGGLDLDLVEAQKLHEMQLAGIDVILEQLRHFSNRHGLCIRNGQQVGAFAAGTHRPVQGLGVG